MTTFWTDSQETCLINQKNELLRRINLANDCQSLTRVLETLVFVSPLWEALGYGYKVKEIRERIWARADNLASEQEDKARIYHHKSNAHKEAKEAMDCLAALCRSARGY